MIFKLQSLHLMTNAEILFLCQYTKSMGNYIILCWKSLAVKIKICKITDTNRIKSWWLLSYASHLKIIWTWDPWLLQRISIWFLLLLHQGTFLADVWLEPDAACSTIVWYVWTVVLLSTVIFQQQSGSLVLFPPADTLTPPKRPCRILSLHSSFLRSPDLSSFSSYTVGFWHILLFCYV